MKVKNRILEFLIKSSPEDFNSRTISKMLNLKESSVRKELSRLVKQNKIKRTQKGFYRGLITPETIKKIEVQELKLHGIKIEFRGKPNTGYSFEAEGIVNEYRKRKYYQRIFEGRKISITVHNMGLVEVWIKTSKDPLGYMDFTRFVSYLEGLLGNLFYYGRPTLSQVGLNLDMHILELEGVQKLTLKRFQNAWSSLYRKMEDWLRIETHMSTKLTLDEALETLKVLQPLRSDMIKKDEARGIPADKPGTTPKPLDEDNIMFG